jgi:hypothetical protein
MVDKGPRPVYAASIPTSWRTALLKEWDGAAWTVKPLKVWNGAAWVTKPLKFFSSALINLRAPNAPSGAAIIGQTLFANDMGDWSSTPDSFSVDWYDDNGAIVGATGQDFYTIQDAELTQHIYYRVTATLGAQNVTAMSAGTVSVADIDLSADTPVLTRTSASGATPYTVDTALGAYTFAGYYLQREIATTNGFGTDLYNGQIQLTEAMLQSPYTIDWANDGNPPYVEPNHATYPQYWERQRVIAISPSGVSYYSNWSTPVSKTDAVAPVVLNASDKTSGITLSNGALTATGGGSTIDGVRATRGISTGKGYWEVNVDLKAGGGFRIGAADTTQSFTSWWGDSASDLHGFCWDNGGTIDGYSSYPSGGAWTTGDRLDFAADGTARKVWMRKNGGTWMPSGDPAAGTGGLSISGITGDILPGMQSQFSTTNAATFHFDSASFVGTPPSGYSAL